MNQLIAILVYTVGFSDEFASNGCHLAKKHHATWAWKNRSWRCWEKRLATQSYFPVPESGTNPQWKVRNAKSAFSSKQHKKTIMGKNMPCIYLIIICFSLLFLSFFVPSFISMMVPLNIPIPYIPFRRMCRVNVWWMQDVFPSPQTLVSWFLGWLVILKAPW